MKILDPQKLSREVANRYSIVNNSFRQVAKDNPKDLVVVEVGDTKQGDFFPQVKICRWGTNEDNNEVNASIRLLDFDDFTVETVGNKVRLINGTKEIEMYDLPAGEGMEDGGFEFNTILKEKPDTNVLTFTLQTKELNFYYQPALTQEEIDEGAERPENVVGSYAVYHATKGGMNDVAGMEYKTGKAFHIYRPKAIDANGQEVWGELNIDEQNGLLTVTLDQDFLDNAVYPVVVDPTFGYTTVGGTTVSSALPHVCHFTSPTENGDITSISQYRNDTATPQSQIASAIYSDSSGSPSSKLAEDTGNATASIDAPQWYTTNITLSFSLSTEYWLGGWMSPTTGSENFYFDTGPSNSDAFDSGETFETWPDPFTPSFGTRILSIYATYTASEGGDVTKEEWPSLSGKGNFWGPRFSILLLLLLVSNLI